MLWPTTTTRSFGWSGQWPVVATTILLLISIVGEYHRELNGEERHEWTGLDGYSNQIYTERETSAVNGLH